MSIPTTKNGDMDRNIKMKNGGRKIILDDTEIDVISGYAPAWTREYSDSFTTWDNRTVQLLRGIRFSLSISVYGLSPDDVKALSDIIKKDKMSLVCDEYSGDVICDSFSADIQNANFYGDFSRASIKFTAVSALAPDVDEGGL